MRENHLLIDDVDWRHRVATTLAEDYVDPCDGSTYDKGTPITVTTYVEHDDRSIDFGDPSAPALFLSQSHKAFERALQIHPFLVESLPSGQLTRSTMTFDYLEEISASIIFAHTAVEAFTNEVIPEDFVYEDEEMNECGFYVVRQRSKDWIERHMRLSKKLHEILPRITGKPSPKGLAVWENFVHLRRLRDRIIHLKGKDRARSKGDNFYPDSIWKDLLDPQQRHYPQIAKDMILHFTEENSKHWLRCCPF